nr:ataxin-2 homolog isoform X1 [Aedes albopictus]
MNKRSKVRPGPTRTQRQRSVVADGIYNNALFMHAATSHVGNIVQVQTASGVIYEGVFRTFSPQFQVVLEMAHRIEVGPDNESKNIVDTVVDRLIFKQCDIVSIAAKDVDLNFAKDTFKTDTAISRCNGNGRPEDRELEPWDESGALNGDCEFNLELDTNANGWDVNDMFHKNETIYGVQSTFDHSLTGYTVQITKKDSDDFKAQEYEAERIANEIENNPIYKDRIDLENGDEESAFAAVVRPTNSSPQPSSTAATSGSAQSSNSMNDKSSPSNNNTVMPSNAKYIVPAKRKPGQVGKLTVRSTPPPLTNNGGPPSQQQQQQQQPPPPQQQQQQQQQPQSPQAPHKNSYPNMSMPSQQQQQQQAQSQQQQAPPPSNQHGVGGMQQQPPHASQYVYGGHVQHQPHQQQQQPPPQHGQSSVVNSNNNMNKMNGDGGRDMSNSSSMNVNSNTKPLPQRTMRQYPNAATVNYNEPPPSLGPQQMSGPSMQTMGKPPMHVTHQHHATHMPPPPVDTQQIQQQQVVMQPHPVVLSAPIISVPGPGPAPPQQQQMQQPPPQPQRQVVDNLRKFSQDFKLAPPQQQPPMQNVHQQPPPQHNVQQMQQQQQDQPPMESSPPISQKHSEPSPHQQQNQSSQTPSGISIHQPQHMVPTQQPQQQPPSQPPQQQLPQPQSMQQQSATSSPPQTASVLHNTSSTGSAGSISQMNTSSSSNSSAANNSSPSSLSSQSQNSSSLDVGPGGSTSNVDGVSKPAAPPKKTFTLNPAAKPFTPRSPSTPNPSRHTSSSPHTPQTPGPVMQQQQQPQPQQQQQPQGNYPGQQHMPTHQQIYVPTYVMPPQTAFQTAQQHPHPGQARIRKGVPVAASQIQVAAATGQPLMTGPIQMFPPYPPAIHHQHFQTAPTFPPRYVYHETAQPAQLQYLTPTPPSTTPSPGQPHQQYHHGTQPSPAAAGPPTYVPAHQHQPPQYPVVCPMVAAPPQIIPTIYQNMTQAAPPQNHHQQNLHVMHVAQHPSAQ